MFSILGCLIELGGHFCEREGKVAYFSRKSFRNQMAILAAGVVMPCLITAASADVFNMPSGQTSLQFVTVGDPGNAPDANGLGSVPYTYQMGEFDVTAGQYTQFLNAVAQTDPYGLYNASMFPGGSFGACGIIQSGSSGSYSYGVTNGNSNLPVNNVTWGDAARFANWLSNGQPSTGVENAGTTEAGSYLLDGAVTDQQLSSVTRSPSATYVLPTENEWYKAAYYKGGSANAGYWLFPTQSNAAPSNILTGNGDNNANFFDSVLGDTDPVNGLTNVGAFPNSPGSYGTFDMGGDVSQWNETVVAGGFGFRGGAFNDGVTFLQSTTRLGGGATGSGDDIGLRIAEVPEPCSMGILSLGVIILLQQRPANRFLKILS